MKSDKARETSVGLLAMGHTYGPECASRIAVLEEQTDH